MAFIGGNNIIQTQILQTNVLTAWSSGDESWSEPNSTYRVSITPRQSNSLIFLQYFVPHNQYTNGANNLYGFRAYRFSPSATELISSAGQQAGSNRRRMAGGNVRALNGYDLNDHNLDSWIAYDNPGTTSTCSYGFQMYRENSDAGTIYLGYSQSDNVNWGMSTRIIITAMEIQQ